MENKTEKLNDIKPVVRSILLSLGRCATVREFLTEFKNMEGIEFKTFLDNLGMNLHQFITSIPDVCCLKRSGEDIYIERVSTEDSKHMDRLTIVKKVKKQKNASSPKFGINKATSSARKHHRVTTSRFSKPQTATKVNSRPPYTAVSLKSLPPAPHQTMKPVVFRSNSNDDGKEKIKASDIVKSLPLPISKTMKPIIFKGTQEVSSCKQEKNLPWIAEAKEKNLPWIAVNKETSFKKKESLVKPTEVQEKLVPVTSKAQHDSEESDLWTDDDEEVTKPVKQVAPRISRNSFVKKVAPLPKEQEKENKIPVVTNPDSNTKFVVTLNNVFEVVIVEAVTPSQFMFMYNVNILQAMKDAMSVHYKSLKDSKDLGTSKLVPGMLVAVCDNGQWQRAEVICINESDVFVHFIDDGSKKYVEVSFLRYLEKTFAAPPRMCYKGSLFGVKPKNGEKLWSEDALKFMSKLNGKKMFASIKEIKDGLFQLSLVKDVFAQVKLSDYMIKAGFADADEASYEVRFQNGVFVG